MSGYIRTKAFLGGGAVLIGVVLVATSRLVAMAITMNTSWRWACDPAIEVHDPVTISSWSGRVLIAGIAIAICGVWFTYKGTGKKKPETGPGVAKSE